MAIGSKMISKAMFQGRVLFDSSGSPSLPEPEATGGVEIYIPLEDLGITSVEEIEVSIPKYKYNKRFAFSYDWDDGGVHPLMNMFEYILGHYTDYAQKWHPGYMDETGGSDRLAGITPSRQLCYTDGCGNDIPFRVGSNATPLSTSTSNPIPQNAEGNKTSSNTWESEIQILSDTMRSVNNHGYQQSVPDMEGARLQLVAVSDYIERITTDKKNGYNVIGARPFFHNRPADDEQYYEAMKLVEDLYVCQANGYKDYWVNKEGVRFEPETATIEDWIKSKRGRGFWISTLDNNEARKQLITEAYNTGYWEECGSHNTDAGTVQDTFIPMFEWIYNTYGKGGNDSIWFGSSAEIFEYLVTRTGSTIEKRIENGNLVIKVNPYILANFREKDLSLLIRRRDGNAITPNVSIRELSVCPYFAYRVYPSGDYAGQALVNLSFDTQRFELCEKYTQKVEQYYTDRAISFARYHINRLSEKYRDEYMLRINPDAPFSLVGISLNDGVGDTTSRVVPVFFKYVGRTAPMYYRISEQPDMNGAGWELFTSKTVNYILSSGYAAKTVYAQLKFDDSAEPTVIFSKGVTLSRPEKTRKAVLSIGGSYSDVGFDAEYKMNKTYFSGTSKNYSDTEGIVMGTVISKRKTITASSEYYGQVPAPGTEKLPYPDYAFERSAINRGSAASGPTDNSNVATMALTLPPGQYTVRLLGNCNPAAVAGISIGDCKYAVSSDDVSHTIKEYPFTDKAEYGSNFTRQLVFKGVSCDKGLLYISWYPTKSGSSTPLNVVEIEDYVPGEMCIVGCGSSHPDASLVRFEGTSSDEIAVESGDSVTVVCDIQDVATYSLQCWRIYQGLVEGEMVPLYDIPASGNSLTLSITEATYIRAMLTVDERPVYTITSSVEGEGTIEPSGTVSLKQGESQSYQITAGVGSLISKVLVDGVDQGALSEYTFSNLSGNHTIKAVFSVKPRSAKLSLGWDYKGDYYDATSGFYMCRVQPAAKNYTDTEGVVMGTFQHLGRDLQKSSTYGGVVPDTGVTDKLPYPDTVFGLSLVCRGSAASGPMDTEQAAVMKVSVPAGSYTVKLFGNCNAASVSGISIGDCKYALSLDGVNWDIVEYPFTDKAEYGTNFTRQLIWKNINVAGGFIYISWYPTKSNSSTPLNVVEIESYVPGKMCTVTCGTTSPGVSSASITPGGVSSVTVEEGEEVKVQCVISDTLNYALIGWNVYQVNSDQSKTYIQNLPAGGGILSGTVRYDTYIEAVVQADERPVYYIQTETEGGGMIEPAGQVPVKQGDSVTLTMTPQSGTYVVSDVIVDGVSVGKLSEYTFDSVSENHTIKAVFGMREGLDTSGIPVVTSPATLSITPEGEGIVNGMVAMGASVRFNVTIDGAGYSADNCVWLLENCVIQGTGGVTATGASQTITFDTDKPAIISVYNKNGSYIGAEVYLIPLDPAKPSPSVQISYLPNNADAGNGGGSLQFVTSGQSRIPNELRWGDENGYLNEYDFFCKYKVRDYHMNSFNKSKNWILPSKLTIPEGATRLYLVGNTPNAQTPCYVSIPSNKRWDEGRVGALRLRIGVYSDAHVMENNEVQPHQFGLPRLFNWFRDNQVNFVVTLGDHFTKGPSYTYENTFILDKAISDRSGIKTYKVSGNHDKASSDPSGTEWFPATGYPINYIIRKGTSAATVDETYTFGTYYNSSLTDNVVIVCLGLSASRDTEVWVSAESRTWFQQVLSEYADKKILLFTHTAIRGTVGEEDLSGSQFPEPGESFYDWIYPLLQGKTNVVYLSGHSHVQYQDSLQQPQIPYYDGNGAFAKMIHIAAMGRCGKTDKYQGRAGSILYVYDNFIRVKSYDPLTGKLIPFGDMLIEL